MPGKLTKIKEIIEKKGLKPSDCTYHTWRDLKNKEGKRAGKIRVLVPKEDDIARVEYICPECQNYGFIKKEWKRPFSIKCEECGERITVPRMKDQIKREQKKGKK